MSVPLCTFIREATGTLCQSPAMKDSDRCYHHQRDHERQQYLKDLRQDPANRHVMEAMELPPLETADDIQICLSNLFHAVAARRLGLHDVDRLLAVLRLASRNVRLKMQAEYEAQQAEAFEDDEDTIPADCIFNDQFREFIPLLDISEDKRERLSLELDSDIPEFRETFRQELFDHIRQQLAAKRSAAAEAQALSTSARDDDSVSPGLRGKEAS